MKLLIINNLSSGLGDAAIYDFIRSFSKDGDEVDMRFTDGTTDLRAFLHDADDYDFVVAAGGDGTISAIACTLADTGIPILPFPAGTGNLLAANLMEPTEPHSIIRMLEKPIIRDFDIGEILFDDGESHGFLVMAGAGFDASIMRDASTGKKTLGSMAYFTSAFANAVPQVADFDLVLDGKNVSCKGVGVLLVNFSKIQFDLSVVHENSPDDGVFDVVVLNTKDAFGLIPALIAAFLDKGGDFPTRTDALVTYRASEVAISSNPPLLVQYDGEVVEHTTPFKARILPKAARFVVSEEFARSMEG